MHHCMFNLHGHNPVFKKLLDLQLPDKIIMGFGISHDRDYQGLGLCYAPKPFALEDNVHLSLDNSCFHAQPNPILYK